MSHEGTRQFPSCSGETKSRWSLPMRFVHYRTAKSGGNPLFRMNVSVANSNGGSSMNAIIYLVGLVVVVMFILSLIGLR